MSSFIKRIFDVLLSLFALLVLSPFIFFIWLIIVIWLGSPAFFVQQRPGRKGQPFKMVKFRTMTDKRGRDGNLLPDEERLTSLGRFLRAASLDELPELINVLRGDMSLVGPRPLLMEYLPLYSKRQYRRHEVRPGVTGWAQINGRNALTWEEKFELDVWYVENQTLWLDIKIIFLTVMKVLKRDGISHEGEATMSRFEGSSEMKEKDQ
jgi:sugar transferase EpsL